MKKTLIILGISLLTTAMGYAQQRDTAKNKETDKHRMNRLIRQQLNVDSAKADQIDAIQAAYKTSLGRVFSSGLSEDRKRRAMDSLARVKNTKLANILTPEQQMKFIPTTERKSIKPTGKQ